jgi:mono/diheme cytochrome c family protein
MDGRNTLAAAIVAASIATIAAAAGKPDAEVIARGKYLVTSVGMCADCHTQRDQKGQIIQERWLQGAPLDFKATVPMPKWAEVAPPLAGLPGWTEAQVVTLLTTGKDQKGEPPDPPMPAYRMSKEDAGAVAAYLASLGKK